MDKFTLDFVGLGFPRSGTTWLGKCLEEHPEIDFAKHKETNFFLTSNPEYFSGETAIYLSQMRPQSFDSYKREFENDGRIRGEFSVYYAYDKDALKKMKGIYPNLKAFLCIRNPIDYLSSSYYFVKSSHVGYKLGPDILDNIKSADASRLYSLERARFYRHVKNCKEVFGDDLCIVYFDDIAREPQVLIRKIYSFIGVDPDFVPSKLEKKVNKVLQSRSDIVMKLIHPLVKTIRLSPFNSVLYDWINRDSLILKIFNNVFKKKVKSVGLTKDIREDLYMLLEEDISKLEAYLNRSLVPKEKREGRYIISTHEFATGPAQELRNYLNASSNNEVAFIASKFVRKKNRVTYVDIYEKGNLLLNLTSPDFHFLPELLIYLKDLFFTIYYALILPGKWDVFVAGDGSLTIPGYLLKKMGKVDKVAFYTIDFSPKRFKNKFLNWLYFKFDEFGVKTADEVWNVSSRMVEGRKEVYNLDSKYDQKQKVVPLGAWFDRIPRVPFEKSLQNMVVYMGHVLEKQGIQHVVKSMPSLKKKGIDIKLRVIGEGEYLKTLKDLAKSLDVSKDIDFLGYIEDHKKVEEKIAECGLAVALYENDDQSFTYFADPGKIKNYLASGVPILITDVPAVAAEIQDKNAGVIVEANQKSIEASLERLLSSPEKLSQMRENAVTLGERYDWNRIFDDLRLD